MTDLIVTDWSEADAAAFMAREWPLHAAPPGVVWAPESIVIVARRDEPLGVACGVVVGGVGELKQLLVRRGDDRGGVGSRLLEEFEHRCNRRGCHKLRLETADYQARPFYERHGFRVAATLEDDRFGRDWFVMVKRVGPKRSAP